MRTSAYYYGRQARAPQSVELAYDHSGCCAVDADTGKLRAQFARFVERRLVVLGAYKVLVP